VNEPARPVPRRRPFRRGTLLLTSAAAATVFLAAAPAALASIIAPESGASPNANQINSLYTITLIIGLIIFVLVEGALFYALFRFRARPGRVAKQFHGNTRLELGWTAGAAVILLVLAVVTFAKLSSIQDPSNSDSNGLQLADGVLTASTNQRLPPDKKSLNILVNGQQFIWRYTYPGGGVDQLGAPYSYEDMVVPTNTTVTLDITSQDVVHSWWIPQLGGKFQAIPGYHNYTWFKIAKPGVYRGQCAEICGRLHARMIATVTAVPPAQFEAWLANQRRLIAIADANVERARAQLDTQLGAASVESPKVGSPLGPG
jgi:cytochrome c oxidase subunit 2